MSGRESSGGGRGSRGGVRKQDWIANQLRRVYDDALQDDIPADMLALLAELDEATAQTDGKPDKEDGS